MTDGIVSLLDALAILINNKTINMSFQPDQTILSVILDSWHRNNRILINLLNSLPEGGLAARATKDSRTVSEMFMHMHHERMISVSEEAPEIEVVVPENEWFFESNKSVIEDLLLISGKAVGQAVETRVKANRQFELNYSHPIHLIQLLIFHEGYHHGQIKTALKVFGHPISDEVAGPITWNIWRTRQ